MRKVMAWILGVLLLVSVLMAQKSEVVWQFQRGDERNSGFLSMPLCPPLAAFWYFLPEEPARANRFGIVHDGQQIYLATASTLICVDMLDGQVKWKKELPNVVNTPPILIAEKVFVGTTRGEVFSFDAPTGAPGPIISIGQVSINALTAHKGTLFIGTSDGHIYTFPLERLVEEQIEEQLQGVRIGYGVATNFAIGERKGFSFLCVGTASQRLFFLQIIEKGERLTLREYARPLLPGGSAMTDPIYDPQTDSVFVGAGETLVRVVGTKGLPTQQFRLKGSFKATPTLAPDGTLLVGTDAGIIASLSARNFFVHWRQNVQSSIQAPMLVTGDYVWAVTFEGLLLGLEAKKGEIRWRFRLADIDPNLINVPVLAPIAPAPFGICIVSASGRVYAFTTTEIKRDTTPPIIREPVLLLQSLQGQQVGYRLYENTVFEEAPAIPGRAPIFLRVRIGDNGTGLDEQTLKPQLLEVRTQRWIDLKGDFNQARGQWLIHVHSRMDEERKQPTRRAFRERPMIHVLAPLRDGEYLVVLKASDYAGNKAEEKFAFRVDNTLPPPDIQAAQPAPGMPGAPGAPGMPRMPGMPGAPGVPGMPGGS